MPRGIRKPSLYVRKLLLDAYNYNPETGIITSRVATGSGKNWPTNRWKAARVVGTTLKNGYRIIISKGNRVLAHRAIWVMVYGINPNCDIDHINGDRSDNRLANLRLATRGQNNINSLKQHNNTSGYKGAYYDKRRGYWNAEIWVNNRKKYLGKFPTAEEAGLAYLEAAKKYFGEEFLRGAA